MDVVHFAQSLSRAQGGIAFAVAGIANAQAGLGVRVAVIHSTERESAGLVPLVGGVQSIEKPNWAEIGRHIDAARALHVHGIWDPICRQAFSTLGARRQEYVISPHGMLAPWSLGHKRLKKLLGLNLFGRRALNSSALVIASSDQERFDIQNCGVRAPIVTVQHGVDLPTLPARMHFEQKEHFTALFLSRVHPVKGLLNLIAAWASVRPPSWRLLIVGPDEQDHLREVKAAVRSVRLEEQIGFRGEVSGSEKEEVFASADLFLLPSFTENFGLVVAEALAHAIPVITTTRTPWHELVERKCGWVVEPTVADLSVALHEATKASQEQRQVIGARGRDLVAERYSWKTAASSMLEAYSRRMQSK